MDEGSRRQNGSKFKPEMLQAARRQNIITVMHMHMHCHNYNRQLSPQSAWTKTLLSEFETTVMKLGQTFEPHSILFSKLYNTKCNEFV